MKKLIKRIFKTAFLKTSKLAVFCLGSAVLSLMFGLIINKVLAVSTWVGPTANPPEGNVEPPINTSNIKQVKEGGLSIATQSGNVGIGLANPTHKLEVAGTVHATGAVTFDTNLSAGNTYLRYLCLTEDAACSGEGNPLFVNNGNARIVGNLSVGRSGYSSTEFVVDSTNYKVKVYADHDSGVLNVGDFGNTERNAIVARSNYDYGPTIYVENSEETIESWGIYSKGNSGIYGEGTGGSGVVGKGFSGIYGLGTAHGVYGYGNTSNSVGVYGTNTNLVPVITVPAGVHGFSDSDTASGVFGQGFTGIMGIDKDQQGFSSILGSTLAGRFIGAVRIENGQIPANNPGNLTVAGNITAAGDLTVTNGNITALTGIFNGLGVGYDTVSGSYVGLREVEALRVLDNSIRDSGQVVFPQVENAISTLTLYASSTDIATYGPGGNSDMWWSYDGARNSKRSPSLTGIFPVSITATYTQNSGDDWTPVPEENIIYNHCDDPNVLRDRLEIINLSANTTIYVTILYRSYIGTGWPCGQPPTPPENYQEGT